jgi:hypothetical protein
MSTLVSKYPDTVESDPKRDGMHNMIIDKSLNLPYLYKLE